jgi:hypothetical protein
MRQESEGSVDVQGGEGMRQECEGSVEHTESDVPYVVEGEPTVLPPRTRRRFLRSRQSDGDDAADIEEIASLHAEVVLLREENARLKAAQHRRADVGRLLGRARALPSAETDGQRLEDDAAQLLVDGLVVRESLLEICDEIERSMVAFTARLSALGVAPSDLPFAPDAKEDVPNTNGHGESPNGHSPPPWPATNHEQGNGHGPIVS